MRIPLLVALFVTQVYSQNGSAANPPCDFVFSTGNAYVDGVGDYAANFLTLQEMMKRLGPSYRYCLIVSPEPEDFYLLRKQIGSEEAQDVIAKRATGEYPMNRYQKVRDFFGFNTSSTGLIRIDQTDVPWYTEEAAASAQIKGRYGIAASLFPESDDGGLASNNIPFLKRFKQFSRELLVTHDYGERISARKSIQSTSYSASGAHGVGFPTGAGSELFYFFDSFSAGTSLEPSGDFEVLMNANLGRELKEWEIISFFDFVFKEARGETVVVNYVNPEEREILIKLLPSRYPGKGYALQPAFTQRKAFSEFQTLIPRYRAVFSGGLTLGTLSTSLGIPTIFQHLQHLATPLEAYQNEVYRRLGGTGYSSPTAIAELISAKGRAASRQLILGDKKQKNIYAQVEEYIRAGVAGGGRLPITWLKLDPKTSGSDKVTLFLQKLGCQP